LRHMSLWSRLHELDERADRALSARGLPGIVPKPRAARIVGSTRGWGCLGRGPQLLLRVSGEVVPFVVELEVAVPRLIPALR